MELSASIITPSFNQARFLERTIRSVLSQDVPSLEYAVCDGGSQDGSVEILKRYEKQVRWVSEKDRGQAQAVNKGLRKTSGEVIGWLNSDDVYYPGAVLAALAFLEAHPHVDFVYGEADHIDEQDRIIEPYPTEPWDPERLKVVCYLCQPAVFFRRRAVERYGLLDERLRFCMDYEYWLRAAMAGAKFRHLPRKLAGSRMYGENKTLGSRIEVHRELNDMLLNRLGRVPDRWVFNYAHAVLDAKGLRREHRVRFSIAVSAVSVFGALRWNRRISRGMLATILGWLGETARTRLREVLQT